MFNTLIFAIALFWSIGFISGEIEQFKNIRDKVPIYARWIRMTIAILFWSWLFYLLHK